ncbi:MAG: M13 family metallopeptidase [Planctomycetales bacterium]|nr:M13 family metallopeptidase [Planctomycetales bacterium]
MYKTILALLLAAGLMPATLGAVEKDSTPLKAGIAFEYFSSQVTPGEDFYQYVNEGWLKHTEIPADRSNYGAFSVLDDEVQEAIRTIIEEAAAEDAPQGSDSQKVGDFFKSYTNVELRNQLGTQPIQPLLAKIEAVQNQQQLAAAAAYLYRRGIAGAFAHYISPDAKRSDQYAVYVTQSGITLPDRDYYLEDKPQYVQARKDLVEYIADMLDILGEDDPQGAAERILALETQIARIHWDRVQNRDPQRTYNKVTQEELASSLDNFSMSTFIQQAGVAQQSHFVVRQPSYLEGLNQLFQEVPLETWKAYYQFQVIDATAMDLSHELEKRRFDFHETALSGVEEQKPLWRRGVEASNQILGEVVGKLYVDKHFPPRAKERMGELVENLKKAFAKRIDALDWMSPVTKKQAHEKLSKFTTKIGYPDEWKDYSKLVIKADDLVGNYLRAAEVEYQRELDKLGGPIDRNEWHMTPQTINAYYNPVMNEIVFPAAILQPPFFNLKADDAVNYGGIGAVIGHEISHGFDDKGSQYDGDGNLRKWWSEADRAEFERRAAQLVAQYDAYKPFEDMHVNGAFTLGENIGDLGGMAVAHEAYRMSLDGQPAREIDGLTGEQRFFMGWGQVWRRLYREPELRKRLVQDPHSPSQYRANGIVSNMDAFYEAFSIQPGDPMYIAPENRVRIW